MKFANSFARSSAALSSLILVLVLGTPLRSQNIRGRVTVSSTGEGAARPVPVKDAVVRIEAPGGVETIVSTTSENGDYAFRNVKYQKVLLTVTSQGRLVYQGILPVDGDVVKDIQLYVQLRKFTVPYDALEGWSGRLVAALPVKISGHSAVHSIQNDCEMHLGAGSPDYQGSPDGLVLEPANVCLERPSGNFTDWASFAESIQGKTVTAEGVVRIWPEHLTGGSPANPNHAIELHPLTRLSFAREIYDFSPFIYAPDGFTGSLREPLATAMLRSASVSVRRVDRVVQVSFSAGAIGNFATLDLQIDPATQISIAGGHWWQAEVQLDASPTKVQVATVEGTRIDTNLLKAPGHTKLIGRGLVLFSLSPRSLFAAAQQSQGRDVPVNEPFMLILYGGPERH